MASADVRKELDCSICLSIYTDPVILRCGHNFCRVCIDRVLDTQEGSGVYTCPECRAESQERPALIRNIRLCNIVRSFQTTQPDQAQPGILCTYCVDYGVSAVKSCLLCEASLCAKHLRVHSKSPEHVLCDPTTSLGNRKCSVHKEVLRYYCTKDDVCICVSCSLAGEHRGHHLEMLDEASVKKKEKLRNLLKDLTAKREQTENRVQRLQDRSGEDHEKAAFLKGKVTTLFRDLQKRVLSDISRQENCVFDLIKQLEIKKDGLSRKMHHIVELCNMSDPVTVLQEPDTVDLCDTENLDRHRQQVQGIREFDMVLPSLRTICDTISGIYMGIYVQNPTDVLLDKNTAANNVRVSDDLKTASSGSGCCLGSSQRFANCQVLSSNSFSYGRFYWEVEVHKSGNWRVGMCYPSIDRSGDRSSIGENDKSWCLYGEYNSCGVKHNGELIWLPNNISCNRFRIYLDHDAGQLSFYALCDPIRHLHTFFATFTEPLHAALWVGYSSSMKISGIVGSCKTWSEI